MTRPPAAPTAYFSLVSTDPAKPDLSAVLTALAPEFTVADGTARPVRRTWLDTFDGRLARAGATLEQVSRDGERVLVLTTADGRELRAPAAGVSWPAHGADLPPGELRELVAPIAGIRALLVVGEFRSRERELRVLNEDLKTVARLVVDAPAGPVSAGAGALLGIRAVRGYAADAHRIAGLLANSPDLSARATSRRDEALAASRQAPDGSQPPVALTVDLPARDAVSIVLTGFRTTLEANVPGLLADIDTEFLHDFRVAVRRARSTVKLTGQVLPDGRADALGAELKWLGDITSPTRDLDVYLLGVPAMAASLQSAPAADLEAFQRHLASRRDAEQRLLARAVRSPRFRDLLVQWRDVGESGGHPADAAAAGLPTGQLARQSIRRAYRRVVRLGTGITPASPAEDLHTLRKRCKELRYLLEIFAPVLDKPAHKQVLQVLKALQECLGDFQDSEVQAEALRHFALEMTAEGTAPPATLLAMGELAAALHAEQLRAREAFDATFRRFMAPKSQRSFAVLTAEPSPPAAEDRRELAMAGGSDR